jgi:16S rRNA (uracil1498-N3)-methyltransferase
MALPFFYISSYTTGQQEIVLDEDNSRHIIQVLRMRPGEALRLTDGKGALLDAVILDDHKKKCRVTIKTGAAELPRVNRVTIAISPVKNATRFEWFLEKATEIGVSTIIPLLCERTERQSIRTDRLRNILVSAMLQSQQAWLPTLAEPTPLSELLAQTATGQTYIAHLLDPPNPPVGPVAPLCLGRVSDFRPSALGGSTTAGSPASATGSLACLTREQLSPIAGPQAARPGATILIGPEGDFTAKEVEAALTARFIPVSLGHNRLRTETAGIVAATLLCIQ